MTEYYGVECKTCKMAIALLRCGPADDEKALSYLAPLDPVACKGCESSHLYVMEELFRFEGPDGVSCV